MQYIFFTLLVSLFSAPTTTYGALLTCTEGDECNFCELMRTIENIVDWLVLVAVLIAVIGLMYSGFRMSASRGDVSSFTAAKAMFGNVVIGIFIIMASWMIVDTIIKTLTGGGYGVWNEPANCGVSFQVGAADDSIKLSENYIYVTEGVNSLDGAEGVLMGDVTAAPSAGCAACVDISSLVNCKNNCTVSQEYAERLAGLLRVHPNQMYITEAYPPTHTHQASCHQNGTCVDIVFADGNFSASNVNAFIAQANAIGMRAVFEPPSGGSCAGISSCIPYSTSRSTGNHFSLYAN